MTIDFTNKTNIMTTYNLTGAQYDLLVKDLGKLTPAELGALSDEFVLTWRNVREKGGSLDYRPDLPPPDLKALRKMTDWVSGAVPSPGAAVMAAITDLSAEQRRQNKDIMIQESMTVAQTMLDQAKELKNKAVTQLVMGIVSGAVTIAQGATAIGMSLKAPSVPKDAAAGSPEMLQYNAQLAAHTAKIQGVTGSLEGVGRALSSSGQAAGGFYDSTIKEMDADIEKRRAAIENLRSLNQSFTELIQKSQGAYESIQQGMNQARTKILG